ncbi:MAG: protein kinase [Polyangiaceae bacterium]
MPASHDRPLGSSPDSIARSGLVIAERFEIQEKIGSGGMGTVYRAVDVETARPVALKIARGQADLERFQREAAALASVVHPRVVRYVAHGVVDGAMYLAMEWLAGEDLASRLDRGPLDAEETLIVGEAAADALAALHDRGLVHRDVKPSNLFLRDGQLDGLTLLDFGIARSTREAVHLTATGQALGTPSYMAPEQARGDDRIDARADVFALGCVLFECLTGRPPFTGDHPVAILAKLLIQDAPRLAEVRPGSPVGLDGLLSRMLSKDPDGRPSNGAALLSLLERIDAAPGPLSSQRPPSVALGTDEQRILCVVLSRPVSGADVTMVHSQHTLAEEQVRAAVTLRGGRLERLANGSLLAAVHGGESPGDLAARAARCALTMAASAQQTPVVLATGRGIVAGRLPAGAVVDQAVRMLDEGGGRPGVVRIDAATAGLLDARFDVRTEGNALCLFGERDIAEGSRTLLGKPIPIVGRERELSTLSATLRECISEPIARAVLLSAPAGGGKSRLLSEFLRGARAVDQGALVLSARCDALAAGSPFAMASDLVCRAAGVLSGESIAAKRTKLRARIGRHLAPTIRSAVVELVAEMAGAPFPPSEASEALAAARADPMAMGDAIRIAWEDWLAAECATGPVVLAIEDLHWGDLPSVTLVDAALRRLTERPFLVIATARPEVHAAFPDLWKKRELQEIRVTPLTPRASERLVREALGDRADEPTAALLAKRAEGHPFFLEELIRAVSEGHGPGSLPETVLGMLEGRLDALAPELRRVLRAASIFGETFWRGAVAALVGGPMHPVARALDDLCAREIIQRRRTSRVAGEIEYDFQHALVRDAAYAMLTDADRALGHELAGDWLERAGETDPMTLAQHFDRGGDPSRALAWYRRGAEQALEGNDLARVLERCGRALACDPSDETKGALLHLAAEATYYRGDPAEAEARAIEAAGLLGEGTLAWFAAVATIVRAGGQAGHNDVVAAWALRAEAAAPAGDRAAEAHAAKIVAIAKAASQLLWAQRAAEAVPLADRLLALAGDLGALSPSASGWVHRVLADRAFLVDGRMDAMAAALEAASTAFERASALRDACQLRAMCGAFQAMLGEAKGAEKTVLRAIAEAERLDSQWLVYFGYGELPIAYLGEKNYEAARASAKRALEGMERSPRLACGMHLALAMAAFATGDLEGAEDEGRTAAEMPVAPPMRAVGYGMWTRALVARGKAEEALLLARKGVELARSGGLLEMFAGTAELALAEAERALGHEAEARAALAAAEARVLAIADRLADPDVRARFLAVPHPNAEILAFAKTFGG